ncbi:MAG: carboxypeptidase-like regulatory domain-containing protein [Planctomycetota bacterium]|jgi:hypothetical protein
MRVKTGVWGIFIFTVCVCLSALSVAAPPTHVISGVVATADGAGVEGVDVIGDNGAGSATTAADGSYSITVPNHWTGTITVSKTGWLITPPSNTYTKVSADTPAQNYTAFQPKISGTVTKSDGIPLEGATVTANNGGGTDTTNVSGYYEFYVPYDWSGTVSASLVEYHFTNKSYTNVITDQANQDFSGFQPRISGSTGVAGATVTVSGVGSVVSTPEYSIIVPYNWSGTITAELVGYNFTDSPKSYTNIVADTVGQNFTPYQPTTSGYVKKADGTALEGAIVTADNGGGSDTTDSSGYYEITLPYNWSGTISAALVGYSFTDKSLRFDRCDWSNSDSQWRGQCAFNARIQRYSALRLERHS